MEFKSKEIVPIGREGIYEINTGKWRKLRPILDYDKCINCGICFLYCPVFAIEKEGKEYKITYDYCKGCGVCANECPKNAIEMVKEEAE
ncbi:MAG: 4Fe-4S binding protein [Bacillota bacterium]|nr:4Fe-4S binding protein [Bacillota bacterium]